MRIRLNVALVILLVLLTTACGGPQAGPAPEAMPVQVPNNGSEPAPGAGPTQGSTTAPASPTAPPAQQPAATLAAVGKAAASAPVTQVDAQPMADQSGTQPDSSAALFYNLPPAILTTATGLYASPNRSDLIVQVPIPAGQIVYVMGRNASNSHLRVVWNTGVGWVPASFTDFNGAREKMAALPVFTREPPGCAVPLTTQFGLGSKWTSRDKQRIAVVADLFRSKFGDFPKSTLSLMVNGKEVDTSRRQIVEQGQFSLKDVVFTLPGDMQPGDTLGYLLQTTSDEPLTFMATIYSVPSGCKWKLD